MVRAIAFYLPQFHPTESNNAWWGPGFTEWNNVVQARPLFKQHYQPRLPGELGFYDIRLPEVREAQADLAREHGLHGFCYHHYWFHGDRMLDFLESELLRGGPPHVPYCLNWANESWTRVWGANPTAVLKSQHFSLEDDRRHINYLLPFFSQDNYIRVLGKPLLLVYRPANLPDSVATTEVWREEAARHGMELYVCGVHTDQWRGEPAAAGFDAAVEFLPNLPLGMKRTGYHGWRRWTRRLLLPNSVFRRSLVYSYSELMQFSSSANTVPFKVYPSVLPDWDNTPRRRGSAARIFHGSTAQQYEQWLRAVCQRFEPYGEDEDFVFINAWNEWAEGAYLEPDRCRGRSYLEATRRVLSTQ